ncbi:hypothetical protein BDK51DRAFT_37456 [Blyttiomyces helicus]|uniref:SH3 domain-containing protein n=1 Tax=Blyttiomyces helicus TaxID=388810 RepID=A0A4P9WA93_9FUNG|nr:hypothetical protein BDK51DRAFT_37456 [Blyttiomyces helicus]|eukprot:RKO87156.1 hypothetical protein BDK51DRAFT_37456 [Blyttiomyces helicus]
MLSPELGGRAIEKPQTSDAAPVQLKLALRLRHARNPGPRGFIALVAGQTSTVAIGGATGGGSASYASLPKRRASREAPACAAQTIQSPTLSTFPCAANTSGIVAQNIAAFVSTYSTAPVAGSSGGQPAGNAYGSLTSFGKWLVQTDPSTSTLTSNSTLPNSTTTSAASSSVRTAAIAGGVAGGLVLVAAAIIATVCFLRRKRPVMRAVPTEIPANPLVAPVPNDIAERIRAPKAQIGAEMPPAYIGYAEPVERPAEPTFAPKKSDEMVDESGNKLAKKIDVQAPETVYRALCAYVPKRDDEINVKLGNEMIIRKVLGPDWVRASNLTDGTEGIVSLSVIDVGKNFVGGSGPAMDA